MQLALSAIDFAGRRRSTLKRATLERMGLSISEAVRVLLRRVAVEQAIPFAIEVPSAGMRAAMEEARTLSHARCATPDSLFEALSTKGE
ncbi:MAG TPA: type II toxin-antitoxin system RelB/DinJ family antitoxin [Rhodopila sp.]|nr:type II toxin-antitoxin system RelB/DinJ family antitoxin [Rhodopila sp.]